MNDQSTALPELSDEAVARIEDGVFERIADEPARVASASAPGRSRRRRWLTGAGIAAAFALGILITPPILNAVSPTSTSADMSTSGGSVAEVAPESGVVGLDGTAVEDSASVATNPEQAAGAGEGDREIIATASATVEVAEVPAAVSVIGDIADEHGGYVESTSISRAEATDSSMPVPPEGGYGWISIRVPSEDLTAVIAELDDAGEVVSSSLTKQDVTSTAIDLRARVEALEASVARLTELMSQSGSVSELIEAEVALTDRQAELESYQQQLAALEDQVAMSSLQIELVPETKTAEADPAGFSDGLQAGWNGLIVSLNALVIALGFLLPWIAVAAVVLVIVWLTRRARRRSRTDEKP
ncbi:DUF4349 domain-containing protein [Microbacterium sp. M28]|uniref:DUF4349 domain-containing protein n=1 Tax=Microbacterium sp. M28 TaxID=2962064 RepID=UPI0021F403A1|nr:DUF4349 domain-containing protein [Microbacterium sp. M28]UYO98422.1 DUF4349 domain-containing protein [Microbacterium sp. M28]